MRILDIHRYFWLMTLLLLGLTIFLIATGRTNYVCTLGMLCALLSIVYGTNYFWIIAQLNRECDASSVERLIEILDSSLRIYTNDQLLYIRAVSTMVYREQHKEAWIYAAGLLKNHPESYQAHYWMGFLLKVDSKFELAAKSFTKSVEILKKAYKRRKIDNTYRLMLCLNETEKAVCLTHLGDVQAAIKCCTTAIAIMPNHFLPVLQRIRLYCMTDEIESASADIINLKNDTRLSKECLLSYEARVDYKKGSLANAMLKSQQAILANPNSLLALCTRSFLFICNERYEDAEADLERVMRLDLKFAEAYWVKSKLLEHLGQPDKAEQCLRTAIEMQYVPYLN